MASGTQTSLMDFIKELEKAFNKQADKVLLPMQIGDFSQVLPYTKQLELELGFRSDTTFQQGISSFAEWYNSDNNPIR